VGLLVEVGSELFSSIVAVGLDLLGRQTGLQSVDELQLAGLLETEDTDVNHTRVELGGQVTSLQVVETVRCECLGEVVEVLVLESQSGGDLVLELSDLVPEVGWDGLEVVWLEPVVGTLADKLVDLADESGELALDDEDELEGNADVFLGLVLLLQLLGLGELGSELLEQVALRLVGSEEGLGTLGEVGEDVLEVVAEVGGSSQGGWVELRRSEVPWDSLLEVGLEVVDTGSLGLSEHLRSELVDELGDSGLELAWSDGLRVLLGKTVAQCLL
jgi:hypothetical protein